MDITEMTKGISLTEETKNMIEQIAKLSVQTKFQKKQKLSRMVDSVLSDLFENDYNFLIPRDFLDTELGVFLFSVKYANQYYYTTYDLEIILDRPKSNLYFHRDQGHLKLINRGGSYEATERDLRRFLENYDNLSTYEVDKRFEAFWNVKTSSDKKVSRKVFKEQFKTELEQLKGPL